MGVYTAWSVVFGEQPSAAKWNLLGANDAAFADGTGIAALAIVGKHLDINLRAGWIDPNETWAFASATTITVPTNATLKYQKGDRIQITQSSTVKYFYIISVAATVLTVSAGNDASGNVVTVANSAISANYYSHDMSPLGFPHNLTYTESWTGFSAAPSGGQGVRFCLMGNLARVDINRASAGTSNAVTCYISLPVVGRANVFREQGLIAIMDNGVQSNGFYTNDATSAATDMHFYKDVSGTTFTTSGSKNIYGSFFYEI